MSIIASKQPAQWDITVGDEPFVKTMVPQPKTITISDINDDKTFQSLDQQCDEIVNILT